MPITSEVTMGSLVSTDSDYRYYPVLVSRRDFEPSWPFPYARDEVPENSDFLSGPVLRSLGSYDGMVAKFSIATSAAPTPVVVGRIISDSPVLQGRMKLPRFPIWNPPKFRTPKPPVLHVKADDTTRTRKIKLARFTAQKDLIARKVERHRDRLESYKLRYERRVAAYLRQKVRRRSALSRAPFFGARREKLGYTEHHPHCLLKLSGPLTLYGTTIYSARNVVGSGYPNNQWYRSVTVSLDGPVDVPAEPLSCSAILHGPILADAEFNNFLNSRIIKKIRERKLNLAVMIGEGQDTVELGADLIRSFSKLLKGVKRKDPLLLTKGISELVLIKNLGISPLIQDLKSIFEWSLPPTQGRVQSRKIAAVESYPLNGCTFTGQLKFIRTVFYRVESPGLALAAELGLTNPALIAWELLPMSFLVDYFLKIGAFLESADALLGLAKPEVWDTVRLNGVLTGTEQSKPSDVFSLYDTGLDTLTGSSSFWSERHVTLPMPKLGQSVAVKSTYRVLRDSDLKVTFPSLGSGLLTGNRLETFSALLSSFGAGLFKRK